MKSKFGKFGIFNIWSYILVYNKHLACEIKFHQNPRIFRNIIFDLSDVKTNFENIYIYMKFDNPIQLYNNFKHFQITWQKKKCWFVKFPVCCVNSSMLQNDIKAYIYAFLIIFKKLFEIVQHLKNRRGSKRIAGSVHCKKNQREILKTVACTLSRNIAFGSVISSLLGNQFYSGKCYI